jgi:predicted PurR-regulated permease PerM
MPCPAGYVHRMSADHERADAAALPPWYRTASEASWRFLAIVAAVAVVLYVLVYLRVVVLPVIIALLVTSLLLPLSRRLRRRGLPDGLAAFGAMLAGLLVLAALLSAIAPSIAGQTDELGQGIEDGVREATEFLEGEPFNVSERELDQRVDDAMERLRENSGPITKGLQHGAVLLGEIITGLFIVILLTFFFLKDGERMWDWIVSLARERRRADVDAVGHRVFTSLAGYVRGIALVGLADAILIGIALLIIGVPLVVPLMILTFIGAFLPLIGAFLAGLAAVLIALVFNGVVPALLVLASVVAVQQVEGHLLYPLLMGRAVHLHPAVIIIALGVGGIAAGIVGVFLAVPVAGSISVILDYARGGRGPESPVIDEPAPEPAPPPAAAGP